MLNREVPGDFTEVPGRSTPSQASFITRSTIDEEMTFADLWRIFYRNRGVLVACLIGALVLGSIYSALKKREYDAAAEVEYSPSNESSLNLSEAASSLMGVDQNTRLETQINILQSDFLLSTVFDVIHPGDTPIEKMSPMLREATLKTFHRKLSVRQIPRSQLIEIKYRSTDPAQAAKTVNVLVDTYVQQSYERRYNSTMQVSQWLEQQLAGVKSRAEHSQQQLTDFQRRTGILGSDESDNTITEKLRQINQELTTAEADRIVKEARYRLLATRDPNQISTTIASPTLQALQQEKTQLSVEFAQLNAKFGDGYPRVQEVRQQLQAINAQEQAELSNIAKRVDSEYEQAKNTENLLQGEFDRQRQLAFELGDSAAQYSILKREVESSSLLYETIELKLKEAGVSAGMGSNSVTVIDLATVPGTPAVPQIPLVLAISALIGIIAGISLAFVREALDSSVNSVAAVEHITSLPIVTIVPKEPALLAGKVIGIHAITEPKSKVTEAYRSLRTSILLSSVDKQRRLVLVTSSVPGEGKSTVSINLAVVMAQHASRVLLIECDLRRPSLYIRTGKGKGHPGLSSLLTDQATLEEAIVKLDGATNLDIIQSGLISPNPAEMLGSTAFRDLLQRLSKEYDYIILDSPPLGAVTDPVLLASMADLVIVVARAAFVTKEALTRSLSLLERANSHVLGIVFNAVDASSDVYYSYGRYGYGYGAYTYGRNDDYYEEKK